MSIIFTDKDEKFYQSWMSKLKHLEQYETQQLTYVYDKFFTLYVVYNFLYATVAKNLAKDEAKKYKDEEAATKGIKNFLGAESLCEDFKGEIEKITESLKRGSFYVVDNKEENEKIIKKLESVKDVKQRSLGILEVIYKVRCNLFHGSKLFEPSQKEILIPLNLLLKGIIEKIYEKLTEELVE